MFHASIGWVGLRLAEVMNKARPLSEAEFKQKFLNLPPAPEFPETAEQRQRLLGQLTPCGRQLVERVMAHHPGLTAAHAIDHCRSAGGI